MHEGLTHVVLAHLSEKNNTPEKALAEIGPALGCTGTRLMVATQHGGSDLLRLASPGPAAEDPQASETR